MATFDFPNHRVRVDYPESSPRLSMGNGYIFAAAPSGPDVRTYTLTFEDGYKYFFDGEDNLDVVTNAAINNFGTLEAFYQTHKLYEPFTYNHPIYGALMVRFNKPLRTPEGIKNGNGALKGFELEFIDHH